VHSIGGLALIRNFVYHISATANPPGQPLPWEESIREIEPEGEKRVAGTSGGVDSSRLPSYCMAIGDQLTCVIDQGFMRKLEPERLQSCSKNNFTFLWSM